MLLTTSCSGGGSTSPEEPVIPPAPTEESYPMAFAPSARASRALHDGYSELESKYTDFGVWTTKVNANGTVEDVMILSDLAQCYRVHFYEALDKWLYDASDLAPQYLKYWDGSASLYTFSAFAPWRPSTTTATTNAAGDHSVTDSDGHIITNSADNRIRISGVTAHAADATDWLVARHLRHIAANVTDEDAIFSETANRYSYPATFHETVNPVFHHILSRIEFRIFNEAGTEVTVDKLTVTAANAFYTSADYLGGGSSFSAIDGSFDYAGGATTNTLLDISTPFEVTTFTRPTAQTVATPTFEIPQHFSDSADDATDITIDITVMGRDCSVTAPAKGGWQPEHYYVYYIRLCDTGSGDDIIYVNIDIDDFLWGGEHSQTIPNW